jgi:hypothetical protein
MNGKPAAAFRIFDVDNAFGRKAGEPGGPPRQAAIDRAQRELMLMRPRLTEYMMGECRRLEAALSAARDGDADYASLVREAYAASQNVRDVAASIGFPLLGFIATNLCTVIETADEARMDYPAAVIDCHFDALRLARSDSYEAKQLAEVPELSGGLLQTVQLVKAMAARTSPGR